MPLLDDFAKNESPCWELEVGSWLSAIAILENRCFFSMTGDRRAEAIRDHQAAFNIHKQVNELTNKVFIHSNLPITNTTNLS